MNITITPGELTTLVQALADAIQALESELSNEPSKETEARIRKKMTRYSTLEEKLTSLKD